MIPSGCRQLRDEFGFDCQVAETMDEASNRRERRQTPESAVDELVSATRQLAAMAIDNPIEYWALNAKS